MKSRLQILQLHHKSIFQLQGSNNTHMQFRWSKSTKSNTSCLANLLCLNNPQYKSQLSFMVLSLCNWRFINYLLLCSTYNKSPQLRLEVTSVSSGLGLAPSQYLVWLAQIAPLMLSADHMHRRLSKTSRLTTRAHI